METSDSFVVEEGAFEALLTSLGVDFSTRVETGAVRTESLYDSFDWRLFRKGTRLACRKQRQGVTASLRTKNGNLEERLDTPPAFAGDLPEGPMRDALASTLSVRRLSAVVSVRRKPRVVHVLNEDRKIVARVGADVVEVARPGSRSGWVSVEPCWTVRPLLGYDDEARAVEKRLSALPGARRSGETELNHMLAAIGMTAGTYSSKFKLSLAPDEASGVAVRRILTRLLETMRVNEAGTIDDLDPEFLHDFRVAVRRTRSCLGQMKRTLPVEPIEPFKKEFAWLGSITGPTRDLDVFLIDLERWGAGSDEAWVSLVDLVSGDQRREQKKMARQLQGARYARLVETWSAFLAQPPVPGEAPESDRPIVEAAGKRIARKYARMVAKGRKIDARRATEALHRLRIDGKKLRYLLEFFRSVYPAKRVDAPIAALKRLQDNLGELNDLLVQQAALPELARRLEATGKAPAETLLLVGRLVERLARREKKVRREFQAEFEQFAGEEISRSIG